ncbi:MAG: Rieske (2Fe-2S) protein [Niveispirillum sp.]|uniref:Rieske (2Fe-2S) protein n=1 Tax=Niveispirillum sp. TaxID=1917217 RepID=UPI003BA6D7C6
MSGEVSAENLTFHDLVPVEELPLGQMRLFTVAGEEVLLCSAAGGFFALRNRCPHAESPLHEGRLRQNSISCPLHGARFDLVSGRALGGTGYRPLTCFPVKVEGGRVWVGIKG